MTVAYQGEPGAYSEAAALTLFPGATLAPAPTFAATFEAVAGGAARRAVVPIENSLFGSVHEVLDQLDVHAQRGALAVVADHWHRVELTLMGGDTALDAVTEVRSHAQALGQSASWLEKHLPEARRLATPDTAGAARALAENPAPGVAVVASPGAAERYGLSVLAERLEGDARNLTRFLVLAPPSTPVEGATRSLLVLTPSLQSPNALFRALTTFVGRRLALHRVEPRPRAGRPGEYHYHVEVEGAGEALAAAVTDASAFCDRVTLVGSFAAAPLP